MSNNNAVIIDDDELTCMLIQRILEREFKFNIVSFKNGLEGLEYVQKNEPKLVVLDLMLPGKNGFEILKDLRQSEKHKHTKIILISAKSNSSDIERGFDLEADEYVTKPFQQKEFVVRVKKLMRAS
ncbi:response regulator transcription factor [Rhodohalobacter sp. 8-1]|uniref:response regulator transcription factor n=1 Tax=Rhodohalobacter sp. 8-1 TaxID=3131972 RepID=UPI0030EC402A